MDCYQRDQAWRLAGVADSLVVYATAQKEDRKRKRDEKKKTAAVTLQKMRKSSETELPGESPSGQLVAWMNTLESS